MLKEEVKLKKMQAEVSYQKYILSKVYKDKYKIYLRILDIAVILCVLMNMSAVFMTNFMVTTKYRTTNYYELNPVQRYINGYSEKKDDEIYAGAESKDAMANSLFFAIMKQLIFWSIIIGAYIYTRCYVYTYYELILLGIYLFIMVYFISFDFLNDLGYLAGEIIKKWI